MCTLRFKKKNREESIFTCVLISVHIYVMLNDHDEKFCPKLGEGLKC